MRMLYEVEYYDDKGNRIRDNVLAKNDNECMIKFKKHHTEKEIKHSYIVNWHRVDY